MPRQGTGKTCCWRGFSVFLAVICCRSVSKNEKAANTDVYSRREKRAGCPSRRVGRATLWNDGGHVSGCKGSETIVDPISLDAAAKRFLRWLRVEGALSDTRGLGRIIATTPCETYVL